MPRVTIDYEKCKGCALCVEACPRKIIILSERHINSKGFHPSEVTDQNKCIGCAFCATMCPDAVIIVEK